MEPIDKETASTNETVLEEAQIDKQQHQEANTRKGPILLQQQLPVDPHRRSPIPLTIIPQPATHLPHAIQTIPPIEQILDILRHDLCNIPQLIIQLVQVLRRARIRIRRPRLGNKTIEIHKRIRTQRRIMRLRGRMTGRELAGQVGKVCECQLARVGPLADAEEDDVRVDEVVHRVVAGAAFDGGLGR